MFAQHHVIRALSLTSTTFPSWPIHPLLLDSVVSTEYFCPFRLVAAFVDMLVHSATLARSAPAPATRVCMVRAVDATSRSHIHVHVLTTTVGTFGGPDIKNISPPPRRLSLHLSSSISSSPWPVVDSFCSAARCDDSGSLRKEAHLVRLCVARGNSCEMYSGLEVRLEEDVILKKNSCSLSAITGIFALSTSVVLGKNMQLSLLIIAFVH